MHLQLSGEQSAHFSHMVFITVDSVLHLFFSILPFVWTVRRPGYGGHSSRRVQNPGLIWRRGSTVDQILIKLIISTLLLEGHSKTRQINICTINY